MPYTSDDTEAANSTQKSTTSTQYEPSKRMNKLNINTNIKGKNRIIENTSPIPGSSSFYIEEPIIEEENKLDFIFDSKAYII